ncbi:MAG: hypothetical protein WCC84_10290 [Candidatus Cybelea sp.]
MKITRSLSAIIVTILIAALPVAAPAQFSVGVGFTVGQPPPPLPVVSQPPAPYPNYMWTPGYWAWGSAGYFWVPGTWVAPPSVGMYWTPGYWGAASGGFGWNTGYWGPTVGFYGGINYGFGFPGTGFYGGSWNGGNFAYNTAVTSVNTSVIHNTYNKTVINKNVCNNCKNVSFNGGKGGIDARPTQAQINSRKNGKAPTTAQKEQATIAGEDRNQLASVNKGRPSVTSSQRAFNNDNKPKNFAPVTTADKQAAAKIPTRGNNTANNKAPTTQNQPAANNKMNATNQNKPAANQNKAANPAHASAQNRPGQNNKMSSATRPASQGQHNYSRNNPARPNQQQPHNQMTRPNQHQNMQGQAMHQGGMPNHQGQPPHQGQNRTPANGNNGKPPKH